MRERAARARRANEQEAWNADPEISAITLLCECGHERCEDMMVVLPDEFDHARDIGARLVSPEHERVAGGHVVERTPRYLLVAGE